MRTDIQKTKKQRLETKGYRPITFLTVVLVLTWVTLIWFGWYAWSSYQKTKTEGEYLLKIENLRGSIIHMDEVLTMSARMAAATGNIQWEERYRIFEPKLDAAIKEAMNLAPGIYAGKAASDTDAANIKLVEMENRSFDLVRQGHLDEAKTLLFSDEYEEQKRIYAQGMTRFSDGLSTIASSTLEYKQRVAFLHVGVVFLLIPLLIIVWFVAFRVVRRWVETLISRDELQKEIDERKRAEEERQESEGRFRSLTEATFEGVAFHEKGVIFDFNDQFAEMFGYERDELIGMNVIDLASPDTRELVKHNSLAGIEDPYEAGGLRSDSSTFLIELHGKPFYYKGKLVRVTSIRDITAKKQKENLESQLQQSQKMESIGTLAGGIAHDFNNILSPIMIHTEMLMMELPPDSPYQHNLKQIFQSSERARDLVKQILTFARKEEKERIPIQISRIVKETIKLVRSSTPTTIDIQYDINPEKDTVLSDPTQINQITMNLCTNAAHAMEENGGTLEVILENKNIDSESADEFSDLEPGHYVKLSVSDTGDGIEPQFMEKIFEPYFTTKEVGKGTGMGLALVHGIVKSYDGAITVKSEVGKGTSFHVYLPLVEDDMDVLETAKDSVQLPTGTERILFVDDEKVAVEAIQPMLERLGYDVAARTSSIEALEAFRNNPQGFDLVITDMTMPNMTGKDLAKELMFIRANIPIILCTGFSEQINEHMAKAMGISAYVMKPIVMSQIANTIREVLDKK